MAEVGKSPWVKRPHPDGCGYGRRGKACSLICMYGALQPQGTGRCTRTVARPAVSATPASNVIDPIARRRPCEGGYSSATTIFLPFGRSGSEVSYTTNLMSGNDRPSSSLR